ncbi:MAG: hypothetical protein HFI10_09380 [Lachnospiraceae bacterium]|jgi:uncharacterized membrane protein YhaH (DUF805 family)|nr:hypothetical protein [Lachnospiraceae bacterium]
MNFWKEHESLRVVVIAAFFVVGLALVFGGWKMTGELTGLVIMLIGLVLLLTALMVYNKPFGDGKK